MTYTVLGRCERTGALGIGIATYSLAVGGLCPAIRSNVGVLTSQSFVNPELRFLGKTLLEAGHRATQVVELMKGADPKFEYRQIGVLDRNGVGAAHTGKNTRPWTGHKVGKDHVALGNALKDGGVVDAISAGFEAAEGEPLAEKLLRALEAGRDAGGQMGGSGPITERSAAIIVHARGEAPEIDLRVDIHTKAVDALRALYDEYKPYVAFHRLRWLEPEKAVPQEQFVASLKTNAGG